MANPPKPRSPCPSGHRRRKVPRRCTRPAACCNALPRTSWNPTPDLTPRPRGLAGAADAKELIDGQSPRVKIPATYIRGGTSKGVFSASSLPEACQVPGAARDQLFMRVIGSPDPYAAHIDMGGATSSTSKCVILSSPSVPEHNMDYVYSHRVDRQALCRLVGQLRQSVHRCWRICHSRRPGGPARIPDNSVAVVRISKPISRKPSSPTCRSATARCRNRRFRAGRGDLPAAEMVVEFMDPSDDGEDSSWDATGNMVDDLEVPAWATLEGGGPPPACDGVE